MINPIATPAITPRPRAQLSTRLLPVSAPVSEMTYPISPDYIGQWTSARAIAEIIANAIDADPEGFTVEYAGDVLTITDSASNGVGAEGMVLGFSDKRGRNDQIGQFGEGLKIATLVLARDPKIGDVLVETVGYAFSPAIVDHAGIGGLSIPTKSATRPQVLSWRLWSSDRTAGTIVRIVCPIRTAEAAMARFRQLDEPGYRPSIGAGQVVADGKAGRIWIGGVLVSERKDLLLSYDLSLTRAKTMQNRDRTIIDGWALNQAIRDVLSECADPVVLDRLVAATLVGRLAEGERTFYQTIKTAKQRQTLSDIGKKRFGEQAVFYLDQGTHAAEAALDLRDRGYTELEAAGAPAYEAVGFWKLLGVPSATAIGRGRVKRKREQTEWVSDKSLTVSEREVLDEAVKIIRATWGQDAIERVRVYSDTRLETGECTEFLGFYEPTSGAIAIRRDQLVDLETALATLTHEATHRIAHRFPRRVGLEYPDYRDRSRGFERALGAMAVIAAQLLTRLTARSGTDVDGAPALDKGDLGLHGGAPEPGFSWQIKGGRWYRRSKPGIAYAKLYDAALLRWAAANDVAPRSITSRFASAAFAPVSAVRSLRDGGTPGREPQNATDVTKPMGLSGGVAWWVTQGVEFVQQRYRFAPRSRHFPLHWKPAWQKFLAEIEALGPDFAQLAPALRALADGTATPDLDSDAWQAPFLALIDLEAKRTGLIA